MRPAVHRLCTTWKFRRYVFACPNGSVLSLLLDEDDEPLDPKKLGGQSCSARSISLTRASSAAPGFTVSGVQLGPALKTSANSDLNVRSYDPEKLTCGIKSALARISALDARSTPAWAMATCSLLRSASP